MRVWVAGVYDGWSSREMSRVLAALGLEGTLFSLGECQLNLGTGEVTWRGSNLAELDGIVVRKLGDPIDPLSWHRVNLLYHLEVQGVRVFSTPAAIDEVNNRYRMSLRLAEVGVPIPETFIGECPSEAFRVVEQWGRAVLKPLFTSKGRGMALLDSRGPYRLGLKHWASLGQFPFYLQRFVDSRYDLGIAFLAGEFIGAFKRVANKDSWQTTIRTGGRYEAIVPAPEALALGKRAASAFRLDYTVVDIVYDGSAYLVYEVSAFGGFSGLKAQGLNIATRLAEYVRQSIDGRGGGFARS